MSILKHLFIVAQLTIVSSAASLDIDDKLRLVTKVYALQPKNCEASRSAHLSPEVVAAGESLFNTTSLSGNRDISCSSCHLDEFGSADGNPIAVGVGGTGEGRERLSSRNGAMVQRNALSLIGRGNSQFTAFFWDGKVQIDQGRVVTQFGDKLQGKFSSPLAAAAVLPLIERDEFLGKTGVFYENDVQRAVGDKLYYERYLAVSDALRERFLLQETEDDKEVALALQRAGVSLNRLELADFGNLLAQFIGENFRCSTSEWDRYLAGDKDALTADEKHGAIIFYGKGRCGACHSGQFFSDFEYHSIGAPQGYFGPHTRHRDIGRAAVTNRAKDLYKFRTPPLTGAATTSPYGHNGAFETLEEAVVHHFNPLKFYLNHDDYSSADYFVIGKLLGSRDPILKAIDIHSTEDLAKLIRFIETL